MRTDTPPRWMRLRDRRPSLRLSRLLPWLSLLLWGGMVGVPAARTLRTLHRVAPSGQVTVTAGRRRVTISRSAFVPYAVNEAVFTHSHALTAVFLPGALVAMPVTVAASHPASWLPPRLELWVPAVAVPPLGTLPAWWLLGLALDAWRQRRSAPRAALAGTLLLAAFAGLLATLLFGGVAGERLPWWALTGFLLWMALFAAPPSLWLRHRLRLRRTAAGA